LYGVAHYEGIAALKVKVPEARPALLPPPAQELPALLPPPCTRAACAHVRGWSSRTIAPAVSPPPPPPRSVGIIGIVGLAWLPV
jgi:hypothetical protein